MPRPDIVLIKPGSQRQIYGHLSSSGLTAIEPPLWGALLAAFLRQQGLGVELFDAEVLGWDWEQTAAAVASLNPRLAVMTVSGSNPSASTMNMKGAGNILRMLKNEAPHIPSALWGLHPSALPQRTLDEEAVDFVVQGEGFYTLPDLVNALEQGGDLGKIPGLWRREDGQATAGPAAPMWRDLDALPQPAWDMLPMSRYRAHNWHCLHDLEHREPYGVIYTSLGCPFHCGFCCINTLYGKPGLRQRSPEAVVAELDYLVGTHGVRHVKIIDEMFAFKESRVIELCRLIAERGYDLNMWAYGRVNTVSAPMLAAMKQAGINWIAYGFESGSARVLKDVAKGYQIEQVDQIVESTRQEGLYINANFIFGLPEDDQASMRATLDLACSINAQWANFYPALAFPGSALYEQALAQGWPLPATWSGYSPYAPDTLPLPTRYLPGEEVLVFRDQAFTTYFSRPEYLEMIRRTFGRDAVSHVRAMASRPLKRQARPGREIGPVPGMSPSADPGSAPCTEARA